LSMHVLNIFVFYTRTKNYTRVAKNKPYNTSTVLTLILF